MGGSPCPKDKASPRSPQKRVLLLLLFVITRQQEPVREDHYRGGRNGLLSDDEKGAKDIEFTHPNNIYKETQRLDGKQYPDYYQNTAEKTIKRAFIR